MWTATSDIEGAKKYLKENEIPWDTFNVSWLDLGWETPKPFYSILLDDRAGLESAYKDLDLVIWLLKREKNEQTRQD